MFAYFLLPEDLNTETRRTAVLKHNQYSDATYIKAKTANIKRIIY